MKTQPHKGTPHIEHRKAAARNFVRSVKMKKRTSARHRCRPPTAPNVARYLAQQGITASVRTVRRDVGRRQDVVRKYRKAVAERRRRAELAAASQRGFW